MSLIVYGYEAVRRLSISYDNRVFRREVTELISTWLHSYDYIS